VFVAGVVWGVGRELAGVVDTQKIITRQRPVDIVRRHGSIARENRMTVGPIHPHRRHVLGKLGVVGGAREGVAQSRVESPRRG
jgi:hypothetical protein